jgi:hypothetical protein
MASVTLNGMKFTTLPTSCSTLPALAEHIVNACPAKNVIDRDGNPTTPFHFSYGRKPSLTNFRIFGCPVYFKRYEPTFCSKPNTYKQQLQHAFRGSFIGFPDNSAGWLVYCPDHPQRIISTRDAYFDEDFSSALSFDSKPFAGALPIRSHIDPNGLQNTENSEPTIIHQTGSVASLGISTSSFIEETTTADPSKTITKESQPLPDSTDTDDETEAQSLFHHQPNGETVNDVSQLGPAPPTPQLLNLTHHYKRHTPLPKEMTL